MNKGDRVRMSEGLKAKLRGDCLPGKHAGATSDLGGDSCFDCSTEHVEEFGGCVGVIQGPTDYNNCKPDAHDYDPAKVGPEVDVRWEPSNLRYAYLPEDLEPAP
jgi:hypothetical protein